MKNPIQSQFSRKSRRKGGASFGLLSSLVATVVLTPTILTENPVSEGIATGFDGGVRMVSRSCECVGEFGQDVWDWLTDPPKVERSLTGNAAPSARARWR